jgi:L-ascorbate metabolism protein UlaG (beta-lactamase superfamily)
VPPARRGTARTLAAAWLASAALAAAAPARGAGSAVVAPGDAVVWYLGHCGYAVETARHLLIFDYIELEEQPTERGLARGFVDPAEIADRDVVVFVSHEHVDHWDPRVLAWRAAIPKVRFVFGWQPDGVADAHFLTADRASLDLDGVLVDAVSSHHAGVPEKAFLVRVDGLALFHGGDYQGRPARGAPSAAPADMRWLRERAPRVDVLFLGAWTGDPYLDIVRGLDPAVIFPMHWRRQESKYREFAAELRALDFAQQVPCPTRRGDRFELRGGLVQPRP